MELELKDYLDEITRILEKVDDYSRVQSMNEDEFVTMGHHGFGQWLRNNWGLWTKDSEVYELLVKFGLWHPDDMSGFLMICWYRYTNDLPLQIEEQIIFYDQYWVNALGPDGVENSIKEFRESTNSSSPIS